MGGDSEGRRSMGYGWDLLRELIVRDLKIRYKRSYLGIAWSLLNPMSQIFIFSFLFRRVLPLSIPHYTAFVFAGVLAWSWFSAALISAPGAIVGNPELVRRPGFPIAMLPLLTVASNGIHYLLALPVLLFFLIQDGCIPGITLVAMPLVIILQFWMTLGLVYLIAAAHVRYRDTQHLVLIAVMLGFYLTPVFYDARNVPAEFRWIYDWNPMAALFGAYRNILIENRWPDGGLVFVFVVATVLFMIGRYVFDRASVEFAEEI
jgi:homopolymeric O-antigen transport system permease protein